MTEPTTSERLRTHLASRWIDIACVAWVVLVGIAVLAPGLVHGTSLGPYDILNQGGLTAHHGAANDALLGDQIEQMIPWTNLAWTQVHAGHLPLWNSYNVMGTPLAFNWQSATFSLPALVSYLLPLSLSYTTQVIVTLIVAGCGAYVLCRLLRLSPVASAFGGVTFELSGPLFSWLGWPIASVFSWLGWILAGFILIQRGQHRARHIVLTGCALAAAVYAGQPDALVVLFLGIAAFVLVSLATLTVRGHHTFRLASSVIDTSVAVLLGFLFSAPLALPGLQLLHGSVRSLSGGGSFFGQRAIGASHAFYGFVLGLVALPNYFLFYYIGVAAVVLALGTVLFSFRRTYVPALAALSLLGALLAFFHPVDAALNALPGLRAIRFPRGVILLAFGTAVLGAMGLHRLMHTVRRTVLTWFGILFAMAGVTLFVVWVTGANRVEGFAILGRASYLWVAAGVVVGLALVALGVIDLRVRSGHTDPRSSGVSLPTTWTALRTWGACLLLVLESLFLVVAGGSVWNSSQHGVGVTPAIKQLQHVVGSSVVGLGQTDCLNQGLGIDPNANILFGIHEYAVYEPLLPSHYYTSWTALTGTSGGYSEASRFCPAFTSASLARRFGVSYVLDHHGAPGPSGGVYVATIADEDLYKIPRVGFATVAPLVRGSSSAHGLHESVVPRVDHIDPGTWQITISASHGQNLRLRLTDVPGWHATLDGRPLELRPYGDIMLQATIPAGHHVVNVRYFPTSFIVGVVLAAIAVIGSVVMLSFRPISERWRRRPIDPATT